VSDHSAHPVHTHCQNCGAGMQGPYCHRCGQRDFEFHRSFGHVFLEALENFFHFDEKFFRNVITLLFRPGQLSADFNAGRRAAQMPPFRLYLFISVLFFLVRLLEGTGGDLPGGRITGNHEGRQELAEAVAEKAAKSADPAVRQHLLELQQRLLDPARKPVTMTAAERKDLPIVLGREVEQELAQPFATGANSAPDADSPLRIGGDAKKARSPLEKALTERTDYALRHQEEIKEAYVHAVPKMLLLCLPFFALYTRVLFRRSGLVYLQHLIVSVHYHTFVFLWWMIMEGWGGLAGLISPYLGAAVSVSMGVWMVLYPLLMLRRLFGQGWLKTMFKTVVLSTVYGMTITAGFALTAIVVVAMI
jgi:hypothetical protein